MPTSPPPISDDEKLRNEKVDNHLLWWLGRKNERVAWARYKPLQLSPVCPDRKEIGLL